MRTVGRGYYTIGSAGHEANGAVALADAAHRPGAAALPQRRVLRGAGAAARSHGGHDAVDDVLLGMLAAVDEPIAGGRHKVFGHPTWRSSRRPPPSPPTSRAPSAWHSPSGGAQARPRHRARLARDAVVVCSFGDASANHSTATGAINAACRVAHQHLPLPLLLVCEDNGLGISVRDAARLDRGRIRRPPRPALRARRRRRPGGDAATPPTSWSTCGPRSRRRPAFLHLRHGALLRPRRDRCRGRPTAAPSEIRGRSSADPVLADGRGPGGGAGVDTPGAARPLEHRRRAGRATRAPSCSAEPELTTARRGHGAARPAADPSRVPRTAVAEPARRRDRGRRPSEAR